MAAGPGPRALDHSGRGALCPAALLPARLEVHPCHAPHPEVTFVLPPNSIPERHRSLQQFQDLRRLSAWEELLLLANVSCEVLFTLLALL